MSAREDYPYNGGNVTEWEQQTLRMCDELDLLRSDVSGLLGRLAAVQARLCQSDWIVCAEALRILEGRDFEVALNAAGPES